MAKPLTVTFSAGSSGQWSIRRIEVVRGEGLASAPTLSVSEDAGHSETAISIWTLTGVVSNLRYTDEAEREGLAAVQAGLGRPEATRAALIPIRKSAAWWNLAQDQRRAIFEERSHHIAIGRDYLPGVARRLHHSRDLGGPFDFLTWFEYAPTDEARFDEMLRRLRATEEWNHIDREVDVRLARMPI